MPDLPANVEIQRRYYAETASHYDDSHLNTGKEHDFALSYLLGVSEYLGINSVLDIGSGTGRALQYLKERRPSMRVLGIEPVKELREIGYSKGLSQDELIDGDALSLKYEPGSFDLVCEFGVLHHIERPSIAVGEMLRVAKKAIFISDTNNFGQGSLASRTVKQMANAVGLWPLFNHFKTGGKGYHLSPGDGLFYSYSVFNNYEQIRKQCRIVHLVNTKDGAINPYRTASHVALLGVKG